MVFFNMAYNKITINSSKINLIIKYLKLNHKLYILHPLGTVSARGNNDYIENRSCYFIRQLTFDQTIVLEQMLRDPSQKCPDIIVSRAFKLPFVPEKWALETVMPRKLYI